MTNLDQYTTAVASLDAALTRAWDTLDTKPAATLAEFAREARKALFTLANLTGSK